MNLLFFSHPKPRWANVVMVLAMAIVLVGLSVFVCSKLNHPAEKRQPRDGFYAVFLSNNQVYFGNIVKESPSRIMLSQVYYVQKNTTANDDVALAKLGSEVHGPEDQMEINWEHVILIERLRPDGKVVQAIQDYLQKKATP